MKTLAEILPVVSAAINDQSLTIISFGVSDAACDALLALGGKGDATYYASTDGDFIIEGVRLALDGGGEVNGTRRSRIPTDAEREAFRAGQQRTPMARGYTATATVPC